MPKQMTGDSQNLLIGLNSPFIISKKYFFSLLFDLDERRLYQTKETTRKAKFRITIKLKVIDSIQGRFLGSFKSV